MNCPLAVEVTMKIVVTEQRTHTVYTILLEIPGKMGPYMLPVDHFIWPEIEHQPGNNNYWVTPCSSRVEIVSCIFKPPTMLFSSYHNNRIKQTTAENIDLIT